MKTIGAEARILGVIGAQIWTPVDLAKRARMGKAIPARFKPSDEFSDTVLDLVHQGKLELTMDWKLKKALDKP